VPILPEGRAIPDRKDPELAGHSTGGEIACVVTWYIDFRAALPKIDIPVLVLAWQRQSHPCLAGHSRP
jgi:hypothetical protein